MSTIVLSIGMMVDICFYALINSLKGFYFVLLHSV